MIFRQKYLVDTMQHSGICYGILQMHEMLLHDVNEFGWNALHWSSECIQRDRKIIGPKHNFGQPLLSN